MLKWLVQKAPDQGLDIITDDPLATLQLPKNGKKSRKISREIYSVNRMNPLFEEDFPNGALNPNIQSNKELLKASLSPPTTTTSRSSSGYGSNTTNGKDDQEILQFSSAKPSVKEATFSVEKKRRNPLILKSNDHDATTPPEPIWPSGARFKQSVVHKEVITVPSKHQIPFVTMQRNSKYVNGISMFGGQMAPNVLEVTRNEKFIASIEIDGIPSNVVTTPKPLAVPKMFQVKRSAANLPTHHRNPFSTIGEDSLEMNFDENEIVHDSIVTDSLLQMTSLTSSSKYTKSSACLDLSRSAIVPGNSGMTVHRSEDMNRVIEELTQAMIKSRKINTLTNAMQKTRTSSMKRTNKLRKSLRALKKLTNNQGVDAMRSLWQQSGQKTNGRKLLVDSLSEDDEENPGRHPGIASSRSRRKSANKIPSRRFPRKRSSFGSSASSDSGSAWSSTDLQVYHEPFSDGSSSVESVKPTSDLYAEVYKDSVSDNSSEAERLRPHHFRKNKNGNKNEPAWLKMMEHSDLEHIDHYDSSNEGSQKKVTFRKDVVDNENFHSKLMYGEGVAKTARKSDVVIEVSNLTSNGKFDHWENYYGATGKFSGNSSQEKKIADRTSDYRSIFTSPYFDYRRTYSQSSNPEISRLNLKNAKFFRSSNYPLHRKEKRRLCMYWKSFLTLFLFGSILVVVILLTLNYIPRR